MDDLPKAGLAGQPGDCIAHRNTPTQTHVILSVITYSTKGEGFSKTCEIKFCLIWQMSLNFRDLIG